MNLLESIYSYEIYITKFVLLGIALIIYILYLYIISLNISFYNFLDFREIGVFNTRELAIFICFIIFILSIKDRKILDSFKQVIKSFFVKNILVIYILFLLHIILIVTILYKINYWDTSFLKDTIIWFIFSTCITIFSLKNAEKDKIYFKNILIENVKISAIIQFITSLYTLNIILELFLVISSFIIGGLLAYAKGEKYSSVRKFINAVSVLMGILIIYYSFNQLFNDQKLHTIKHLKEFSLPIIFTIWFIPFFYILYLYMIYESIFISLNTTITNSSILIYAKKKAIITFRSDIALLRRWMRRIFLNKPNSKKDIDNSITEIINLKLLEENPPVIKKNVGWSPYKAKNFLNSEGISTGYYDKCFDDEWLATSPYIDLTSKSDLIDENYYLVNSIAYNVSGNSRIVKQLQLSLKIYSMNNEETSLNIFLKLAILLFKSACYEDMPDKLIQSILKKRNTEISMRNIKVLIKKHNYVNKISGYSLIFTILYIERNPLANPNF